MQKEVAMYRRFLNELLFVYNEDHPQQALRKRIKAALAGDWDAALIISKLVVDWNEYATEGVENNEFSGEQDTEHLRLLPPHATSDTEGNSASDREGFPPF